MQQVCVGLSLAVLLAGASAIEVTRGGLRGNHLADEGVPHAVASNGARFQQTVGVHEFEKALGSEPIRIPVGPPPAKEADESNTATASRSSSTTSKFLAVGEWTIHHIFGMLIFVSFVLSWGFLLPIIREEWSFYKEKVQGGGDTFNQYLSYRFMDWFTGRNYAPPIVLCFITVSLIVTGAIIYSLLVGGSPSHALWRIFVWSTGSPAEGEVTGGGRFLGTIVTVCGLIILSLLLGIVTETFATKMNEIKSGQTRVVEGGHTVILGYSDCTRCLLEELSNARESDGGGVFVILSSEGKDVIERRVAGDQLNLHGSRVIVRSGKESSIRDLQKVSASSAAQVVIMADTTCSPEEADAKSIRTLLSLKTQNWPTTGRIVVQACSEANIHLFQTLYDPEKVEVVIVGNIVAELMARSSEQHGLATVFGMMMGFVGDEFYSEEHEELVGHTFREAVFRFPAAVALGVLTAEGCKLNPGWNYKIEEGDKIIVLAEDDSSYEVAENTWGKGKSFPESVDSPMKHMAKHSPRNDAQPKRLLLIGWNNKACALLNSLDDIVSEGSEVMVYSPCPEGERVTEIMKFQQEHGEFHKFKIAHAEVEETKFTSRLELSRLKHETYDSVFLLAETCCSANTVSDERSMTILSQLTYLRELLEEEEGVNAKHFDPVVEMCEDSTFEHLKICGFTNFVHSNSLVSQALAAVTEDPSVNSIYADLMSGVTNSFEFVPYEMFLPKFSEVPAEVCFWDIAYMATLAGDISVVGWTEKKGDERKFVLNPKDKITPRPWTADDRVVIIRRLSDMMTPRKSKS